MINRIKQSEVQGIRERTLKEQQGICPLCGYPIDSDPVLDHCHDTGKIRGVLHRQCNHAEGRVLDWIKRTGKRVNPLAFIKSLAAYWSADFSKNPYHYTHSTAIEKEIRRLKKQQKKLKTEKKKAEYQQRIEALQRIMD
jgi:hypothetical protein